MIFVTLGTQDKSFKRLLRAIDKEIKEGTIDDRVVVQAGHTKYESKNMEIFDLISPEKFDELMNEADLVITHGGAGSILTAIKKDKKVIAAPRLKKYKEHTNDHQKEIIEEFAKDGYILPLYDFSMLGKMIKKSKTFKPKKFKSNTENMIKLINDYIEEDNHTSWYNKTSFIFKYFIYLSIYTILVLLSRKLIFNELYTNINFVEGIGRVVFYHFIPFFIVSYFIEKKFIFGNPKNNTITRILLFIMYLITNPLVFLAIRFDSKLFVYSFFFVFTCLVNKFVIFRDYNKNSFIDSFLSKYIDEDR